MSTFPPPDAASFCADLVRSHDFSRYAACLFLPATERRAMLGLSLKHALWRAVAWPLATVIVAAGLGILPAPASLPAGAGGLIGIAAHGLSVHAGQIWQAPIQHSLNEHCIPKLYQNTVIEISTLGVDAELVGAAALVMENYERTPSIRAPNVPVELEP